eukprot:scaffold21_cov136-Skeletonema_marinoi.AAC.6
MRNNNFNFLFVACVWASTAAADHSFLRSGRKLEWCEDIEDNSFALFLFPNKVHPVARYYSAAGSIIYAFVQTTITTLLNALMTDAPCSTMINQDAVDDIFERTFERCSNFDGNEKSCWGKYPDCVYRGRDKCEDRSNSMNNGCTVDTGCEDDDEICVPLQIFAIADPCLANEFRFGQCIRRPKVCPSTTDEVCGCNGETTYKNSCESLKAEMNVMYNDSCSRANENAFRKLQKRYMREHNIDDGDHTDEYLWAYMRGSVRTDGNTCLNEFECKKQSIDIGINNFIVTSDPYNW